MKIDSVKIEDTPDGWLVLFVFIDWEKVEEVTLTVEVKRGISIAEFVRYLFGRFHAFKLKANEYDDGREA